MHNAKPKILLAEDDLNLGNLLVDYLQSNGFEVKLCKDGEAALIEARTKQFNLFLLDVMMPKMDGFTVAKEIRKAEMDVPIIFITAKSMKDDKLKGYGLGADDYIIKPFDEEELLWKIKAIIRRVPEKQGEGNREVIALGEYDFNYSNQSITWNGKLKRITEKESDILKYLCDHKNHVIKREIMLKELWGENDYFLGRSLDVFITKIRKYLKEDPNINIENVFGVGFIFNVPEPK
jgi:DNA-binding response OmpR family regulator